MPNSPEDHIQQLVDSIMERHLNRDLAPEPEAPAQFDLDDIDTEAELDADQAPKADLLDEILAKMRKSRLS